MALELFIKSGPLEGQRIQLNQNLTLGRSRSDVDLNDSKASSVHASIKSSEPGTWILEDNGSTNGTRINGEKVDRIHLEAGMIFQIGRTEFEVVEASPSQEPEPEDSPPVIKVETTWQEKLARLIAKTIDENLLPDAPQKVFPLDPAVELTFIGGAQSGTVWTLGYGPRQVGGASYEFPLLEPEAPDVAFSIQASPKGSLISSDCPSQVFLNGQELHSELLKDGDQLSVGKSTLRVRLIA